MTTSTFQPAEEEDIPRNHIQSSHTQFSHMATLICKHVWKCWLLLLLFFIAMHPAKKLVVLPLEERRWEQILANISNLATCVKRAVTWHLNNSYNGTLRTCRVICILWTFFIYLVSFCSHIILWVRNMKRKELKKQQNGQFRRSCYERPLSATILNLKAPFCH